MSALTPLMKCCGIMSPSQFIVQVNTQVLVRCHHLKAPSLDAHWCKRGVGLSVEVHPQVFHCPSIDMELVSLTQVHKVLD